MSGKKDEVVGGFLTISNNMKTGGVEIPSEGIRTIISINTLDKSAHVQFLDNGDFAIYVNKISINGSTITKRLHHHIKLGG